MPAASLETRIMKLGQFELWPTALTVVGGRAPSLDQYDHLFSWLRATHTGIQWWIGDAINLLERDYPERSAQIIDASGWDEETIRVYRWVCHSVAPVNRLTGVPFGHYVNGLAAMPPVDQQAWAKRVQSEGMTRSALRTALRVAKRAEVYTTNGLPQGVFRVFYADPPWPYDDSGVIGHTDAYGRAERHYPVLSIDELCALPVKEHAADDAVLFLWVTAPLLLQNPGPREVIEAWGFAGKTGMVWDKVAHNFGHYISVRHEHLIICTRGSCVPDQPTPMPDSVYSERRSDVHSQKPKYFRDLIDRLYPLGPALELFGREEIGGRWTVYGNQIPKTEVA